MGSAYVNDFPNQGRLQRVIVQADTTGEAMAEMERLVAQLPPGFAFEWTGASREEKLSGSQATILLAFSMPAVFFVPVFYVVVRRIFPGGHVAPHNARPRRSPRNWWRRRWRRTATCWAPTPNGSPSPVPVPVGLASDVLLQRPDVIQAEQSLIAASTNIGVARAAIFDSGRNQANLNVAQVNRDIAVAQYEKAVQSAFRETADALAGLSSWREQLDAQRQQRDAAREIARLTELRYTNGATSVLERLDAERSLLAAEQTLVQTRLAEQVNRVVLFKALGG